MATKKKPAANRKRKAAPQTAKPTTPTPEEIAAAQTIIAAAGVTVTVADVVSAETEADRIARERKEHKARLKEANKAASGPKRLRPISFVLRGDPEPFTVELEDRLYDFFDRRAAQEATSMAREMQLSVIAGILQMAKDDRHGHTHVELANFMAERSNRTLNELFVFCARQTYTKDPTRGGLLHSDTMLEDAK